MPVTVGPPAKVQHVGTRVISVFGTKGGVGKTVVATNLAVALSQRVGKPVCLIDLELMALGDAGRMLMLTPQHSISEFLPHLKRKPMTPQELPIDQIVTPHASGVHLLPCVNPSKQMVKVDPQQLAIFLGLLRESGRYPYIVIDSGKAFTDQLITAFDTANLILLVGTPDIISLYQTKWALGIIEDLRFPTSMVKVVLNRAESRGGVGSENVRTALPADVIGEIPSDGRVVGTSINEGVPLVTAYATSRVAEAFRKLAEGVVTRSELYIAHQAVPRHQGPPELPVEGSSATWLSRLITDEQAEGAAREDEIVLLKRRIHEQLVEELDLKKLDLTTLSNLQHMQELRQKTERVITNLLTREVGGLIASHEVRQRLVKEISDEALGLGPLEELLDDPEITDILVNNKDQIYVERRGKLELTAKKFISDQQVRTVIERIVAPVGRRIDEANPMVDARLPDGSRINAIIPPLSMRGSVLSIRKFGRERLKLEDLIRLGALSPAMARFLEISVSSRKNIIVSGGTGSGKTTLLNVLSAFIPSTERIISLEDAAELRLVQEHWISLEARPANIEGRGQIGVRELFRNSLRMRPDRIIIGECRGEETLDMLQAMNTGHDGSLTTIHANSPKDVIARLDSLVLMSKIDLPVRAIREMVVSAIHLIAHTARLSDGSRKVMSISEVIDLVGNDEVVLRELFFFRQRGVAQDGTVIGEFAPTGHLPSFLHDLKVKGIDLDEAIFTPPPGVRPQVQPQVPTADNGGLSATQGHVPS